MKKSIHPDYRPVVFRDRGAGFAFLTRSTAETTQSVEWEDGATYPVVDVEVSSASHPFYTGKSRVMDSTGAVEKFNRRYSGRTRG
ncbi:type B 50S ribosomal protein L31 [Spirillospora sp. NPDC047279]|uniref:type B 50S ribosomal protein L31 n=1 Tax=Spirillospora sp. NPDC047279 TaxID=3155478 RepID=UPI0033E97C53